MTTEMSQVFAAGVTPSRTNPKNVMRLRPSEWSTGEGENSTPRRHVQFAAASVLLGLLGLGFVASSVGTSGWSRPMDVDQLVAQLVVSIALLVLLASWISFSIWRREGGLGLRRVALAAPCLFWASQSINGPIHLTGSHSGGYPSGVRIGAGVVGSLVLACEVFRPRRPVIRSYSASILLSIVAISASAFVVDRGFPQYTQISFDAHRVLPSLVFPVVWSALGLLLLMITPAVDCVLRRSLGASLLLLALAQVVGRPPLGLTDNGRAMAAAIIGLFGVFALLFGLAFSVHQAIERQRARVVVAELEFAQTSESLRTERLLTSRNAHDQKAALLSVEAVIRLLETSDAMDAGTRHRLCEAATDELRRMRLNRDELVERDLRTLVEPIVALANAAGANVTLAVRPGLGVEVSGSFPDIVRNLITNAVRHGHNAQVLVEARRVDYEFIELSIRDSGPGVTSSLRFDLFELGRTSGGAESSGIGLHSARSTLRIMGGDLVLDRGYVGGARFVATIPAAGSQKPIGSV